MIVSLPRPIWEKQFKDSLKQKERDSRMPGAKLDVYLQSRA